MKLLESLKCPYSVIKELIEGGFIIMKEDGVTIVKHWLWHNQIDPKSILLVLIQEMILEFLIMVFMNL